MTNTKHLRDRADDDSLTQDLRDEVWAACDEIDQLRKGNTYLLAELNLKETAASNFFKEGKRLEAELAKLREDVEFLKLTESKQIDELRTELERETKSLNSASDWIKELQSRINSQNNLIDRLREQVRPRSIKDEPPSSKAGFIQVYDSLAQHWYCFPANVNLLSTFYTYWMPEIPAPPAPDKPDTFEEWCKNHPGTDEWWVMAEGLMISKSAARVMWDAGVNSTKETK